MRASFKQLTKTIYAGIFPKSDVSKGLEYIDKAMPAGDKRVITVNSADVAGMNFNIELVKDIKIDYNTERLLIVEIQ